MVCHTRHGGWHDGVIEIRDKITGAVLNKIIKAIEQRFPAGLLEPPDHVALELVEKVLFIQGRTRVMLSVPDMINHEEINDILTTQQLLKTGKNTFKAREDWKIAAHLELARRLLEIYENGMPARLDWHWEGGVVDLFGAEIRIGTTDMYCDHTYLTKEDMRR